MKKTILPTLFAFIAACSLLSAQEVVVNADTAKAQKAPPQYEIIYKGHFCHQAKDKGGDDVTFIMIALPATQSSTSSPGERLASHKTHFEQAENFKTGDSLSNAIRFYKGDDATITLKCIATPTSKKTAADKKAEQDGWIETLMMTAETTAAVSAAVSDKEGNKESNNATVSSKGVQSIKKKEAIEAGDADAIPSKPSGSTAVKVDIEKSLKVDPLQLVGATMTKGLDMLTFRKKSQESILAQSNKTIEEEDRVDILKQGRQQKHGIRHHFSMILEEKDKKEKVVRKYELFFEVKMVP